MQRKWDTQNYFNDVIWFVSYTYKIEYKRNSYIKRMGIHIANQALHIALYVFTQWLPVGGVYYVQVPVVTTDWVMWPIIRAKVFRQSHTLH